MALVTSCKATLSLIGTLLKTFLEMIRGVMALSNLHQPPITIFGGSKLKKESKYMKEAHELARRIGLQNIPVLTGGGPGIMEAANCGILHEKLSPSLSIGITVTGLDNPTIVNGFNCCASTQITMQHFFSRKWLLMKYSIGFVVFPGGFGTLDELFEALALIQNKKNMLVPVILIGKDYWQPLMSWIEGTILQQQLITEQDYSLITLTDDLDEVLSLLIKYCKKDDGK